MYHHDISRVMTQAAGENGVLNRVLATAAEAIHSLQAQHLPVIERCLKQGDLGDIETIAADIVNRFSTVVVCGMGGSSLSGKMLTALALNPLTQNSGKVRLAFLDNIDPASMDMLLASIDFAATLFIVISKSGGTVETLTHMSMLWSAAENKLGRDIASTHFLVITEPHDNPLRRFAAPRNIRALDHDPDIGGRYAALTVVGLLPACIAGLNIRAIRKGAADVIGNTFRDGATSAVAQGAALSHMLAEQGKNICVLLPFCDRLLPFAMWHRQIWAESLGKQSKGITPAPALGSVDQHSQLQLYLDGPRDKFFSLILLDQHGKGALIPSTGDAALSYLERHTIGDLMEAHQHAMLATLTNQHCPVRVVSLATLNEEALGALTMHFMLETIITARLMGVDPFDQPAVEAGKKLAIQHLITHP
jgi:glucose-6-phosphate isomerase